MGSAVWILIRKQAMRRRSSLFFFFALVVVKKIQIFHGSQKYVNYRFQVTIPIIPMATRR